MRLIDADKFRQWLMKVKRISKNYVLMMLDEEPTIDAEPVRHGRWIEDDEFTGFCSNCEQFGYYNWHYCPNCGSRMGLGEEK